MKHIEFDCQASSSESFEASNSVSGEDWTTEAERLLETFATHTAKLVGVVKGHYIRIGQISQKILNLAERAGESKQAQAFIRRNFAPALRKDLEKGRKLWEYLQKLGCAEEEIDFILSNTGFDTANAILSKLPDTLSKIELPGVLEDLAAKKLEIAADILTELVEITLKQKDGEDKNGVKPSDVGRLIKLHSVPDCDRVEFKEASATYRAEVLEYDPDTDAVKVRIDGSGEEKEIPRGTVALKEQKAPRLHEPCLIQGDEIQHYNKCGIFKALSGDDKAVVLLLDGNLVEIPKKQLVKGKKGSPIPELLQLLDESGNAEKVSLAVEKAVEQTTKAFEKEMSELRKEAGQAFHDGRISVAAEAREMRPSISLDAFLKIPVGEKLEIFAAQPEEAKNLILANYVKSLPVKESVVRVQPPAVKTGGSELEAGAIVEIEASAAQAEPVEIDMTRFAKKDLSEKLPEDPVPPSIEEQIAQAEVEYQQALDALETKKKELGSVSDFNFALRKQCEVEIAAEKNAKTKLCRLKLQLKELTKPKITEPEYPDVASHIEAVEKELAGAIACREEALRTLEAAKKKYPGASNATLANKTAVQQQEYRQAKGRVTALEQKLNGLKIDPIAWTEEEVNQVSTALAAQYQALKKGSASNTGEVLLRAIEKCSRVGDFLLSEGGKYWLCLYYFSDAGFVQAIATDTLGKEKADEAIARAMDAMPELNRLADLYRNCDREALKNEDPKIKLVAQQLLTLQEREEIKLVAQQNKPTFPNPQSKEAINKETVEMWLTSSSHVELGISYLRDRKIPLLEVVSVEKLKAMVERGGQFATNAFLLVEAFNCRDVLIDEEEVPF